MATVHSAVRAYVFGCTYDSNEWLDNPSTFISDIQTELSGITDLNSYNRLIVSNMRNASVKDIEVEIDGITYKNSTKLTQAETDDLITDLTTAFDNITDLTYTNLNVYADVFREDQTTSWPGQSMEKE